MFLTNLWSFNWCGGAVVALRRAVSGIPDQLLPRHVGNSSNASWRCFLLDLRLATASRSTIPQSLSSLSTPLPNFCRAFLFDIFLKTTHNNLFNKLFSNSSKWLHLLRAKIYEQSQSVQSRYKDVKPSWDLVNQSEIEVATTFSKTF